MNKNANKAIDEWSRKNCKNPRPITLSSGARGMTRCYSRDPRACIYCSELNRLEMKILIGSGCNANPEFEVDEEMLKDFNFYWDTLTAPSFGRTHSVSKTRTGDVRRCVCGEVHNADSPLKGVPVGRYDRKAAVEWNSKASTLITVTFKRLRLNFDGLEYAIVREYQARGSIHLHYLVRVPKSIDSDEVLDYMAKMKNTKAHGITWGSQTATPQLLTSAGRVDSVRYMSKVVGYSSKAQGLYDKVSPERMKHYDLMSKHAQQIPHNAKCDPATCLSTAHRNLGFKGQILSLSHGWSLVGLSRRALADRRREWVKQNVTTPMAGEKFTKLSNTNVTKIRIES